MTHVQKDTALMLKEKGFDVPCEGCYGVNSDELHVYPHAVYPNKRNIPAPTLYEACEWLRAKGVHVAVDCLEKDEWYFELQNVEDGDVLFFKSMKCTHDLALESGIVHALKNYVK